MMLVFYTPFIKHMHNFLKSPINILGITGFADQSQESTSWLHQLQIRSTYQRDLGIEMLLGK